MLPPGSRFVGPLVRPADHAPEYQSWTNRGDARTQIYAGFGTFLSHRGDVLARVAEGLRLAGVRAAIAAGPTPAEVLSPIPTDWFVAPTLPQVNLVSASDLIIHHGGNNSVQESLATGGRQIVMPFSTDQFANAADLERIQAATPLAPNTTRPEEIAAAIEAALAGPERPRIGSMSDSELAAVLLGDDQANRLPPDDCRPEQPAPRVHSP
jgi:UDP:flavonoid glycosyltransferase YjiC (YdhE family)